MARSTLKPCSHFGCGELVAGGGRCPRHRAPDTRPSAAARGYGSRWRAFRARYIAAHPSCAHCGGQAEHVHHIDGAGPLGPRGLDPSNCLSLCPPCHSRVTAQEQPGGWARDQRSAP